MTVSEDICVVDTAKLNCRLNLFVIWLRVTDSFDSYIITVLNLDIHLRVWQAGKVEADHQHC